MFKSILFGSLLSLVTSKPFVFVWYGKDAYPSYKQWHWDTITHIGFFSDLPADLVQYAKAHDVLLIQARSLPEEKKWSDAPTRTAWIEENVKYITSKGYNGLSFDFEGNFLSSGEVTGYTALAKETKAALMDANINGTLGVCIGGRPNYEFRNFDYKGLSEAADHLFLMSYDLESWDDYTCFDKGTCSLSTSPIDDVERGIQEYLKIVPASKLIMGLAWYGQIYQKIVIPINQGQIPFSKTQAMLKAHPERKPVLDAASHSWKVTCSEACFNDKKGTELWFEDAASLAPKYKLAGKYGLQGVGMWNVEQLDYVGFPSESESMWTSMLQAYGGGSDVEEEDKEEEKKKDGSLRGVDVAEI